MRQNKKVHPCSNSILTKKGAASYSKQISKGQTNNHRSRSLLSEESGGFSGFSTPGSA
jgi:hypothetical protein